MLIFIVLTKPTVFHVIRIIICLQTFCGYFAYAIQFYNAPLHKLFLLQITSNIGYP